MISYFILFGSSFLAATILPFYSEIALFAMAKQGYEPMMLLMVATLGNTTGAMVNWFLGLYLLKFKDRPWFYFSQKQIDNAQSWYQKYGKWSLLMAWLPIGGDALTVVGGIMRVKLWLFTLLVGIGKFLRYWFVLFVANSF